MTESVGSFVEILASFNRKERFILLEQATSQTLRIQLNDSYRGKLATQIGKEIPESAYVAMDYHLNWLAAAVQVLAKGNVDVEVDLDLAAALGSNQEDIDLLVAWTDQSDTNHLVLVEAKAHTAWSNSQITSKMKRLNVILESAAFQTSGIKPSFVITSFDKPPNLKVPEGSEWILDDGEFRWVPLERTGKPLRIVRFPSKSSPENYWIETKKP